MSNQNTIRTVALNLRTAAATLLDLSVTEDDARVPVLADLVRRAANEVRDRKLREDILADLEATLRQVP